MEMPNVLSSSRDGVSAATIAADFSLEAFLSETSGFCLLNVQDESNTLVFRGSVQKYTKLADIPRRVNLPDMASSRAAERAESSHRREEETLQHQLLGVLDGDTRLNAPSSSSSHSHSSSSTPTAGGAKPRLGPPRTTVGSRCYDTISMIPFCQIREKCCRAHSAETNPPLPAGSGEDDEKILCLHVDEVREVWTELLCGALPDIDVELSRELQFDSSDEEYEKVIADILRREICGGEGSSFVTPRACTAKIRCFSLNVALAIYKRLLCNEFGCYWKYLFSDGELFFICATPERHLTVDGDGIRMNPISGTFRKSTAQTREGFKNALLCFLEDQKEIDELFMVTDEELKMICRICPDGGGVVGPLLKEMAHLAHTEYVLCGSSKGRDVMESLVLSLFAPTVTGSPMKNACERLYEYEKTSRGYYSGVMVLMGRDIPELSYISGKQHFQEFLDSCINIRLQEIRPNGLVTIRVGATLVKDSVPREEVAETKAKIAAAVRSIVGNSNGEPPEVPLKISEVFSTPSLRDVLDSQLIRRNSIVSQFWMNFSGGDLVRGLQLPGPSALLMNNDDDFIYMLEHLLRKLGVKTHTVPWNELEQTLSGTSVEKGQDNKQMLRCSYDIVVVGPGPGDPLSSTEKMKAVQSVCKKLVFEMTSQMFFCVCLGHQNLSRVCGFPIERKAVPVQGVQKEIDLFGRHQFVGFYNSFCVLYDEKSLFTDAKSLQALMADMSVSFDPETKELYAMRAKRFTSFQFHPESLLTRNGLEIMSDTLRHLLDRN